MLAREIENFFLPPGIAALDEYGIPLQVARKLIPAIGEALDLDSALAGLRRLEPARFVDEGLGITPFERTLIEDALRYI